MQFEDLAYLEEMGAVLDSEKKRIDFSVITPKGEASRIVGYFPSESMQIFAYNINKAEIPDLGLDFCGKGRYLRINCCKSGRCEFKSKEGKSAYVSTGEISMDFYIDDNGTFSPTAEEYMGVEIIMQVDSVIEEIPTLAMLKKAIKRMDLPEYATHINSLYFINASEDTKQTLDTLFKYCINAYDWEAIVIKTSELGHNIGTDLVNSKAKVRTFATSAHIKVAEDIHTKLTEEYGEKWTVGMFAEKYGVSESSIKNYFRNVYGYSFKEYQTKVRMEKAAEMLKETDMNVSEIASKVGYISHSKFGVVFKNYHGTAPLTYRRNSKIEKVARDSESEIDERK